MKILRSWVLPLVLAAACQGRETSVRTERPAEPARAARAGEPGKKKEPKSAAPAPADSAWHGPSATDWLAWRGPHQNGTSDETAPPTSIDPAKPLWSVPIRGRGTPVVAGGLVYTMGYQGEDATCVEMIACLDARTGEIRWQELFPDFLSDVVYSRYSIGSPTVDPETGNVYCQSSPGRLIAYTRDGKKLWEHSLMEEYGKLTFPNGRTGAPLVVGDRVIVHIISSAWGPLGPARDRFYAFDKKTGENLWSSTPGEMPQDNSFSFPIVFEHGGKTVLAAETGCGHLACLDVATGDTLWRYRIGSGANSSPVLAGDAIVTVHGNENLDDSTIGRLAAIRLPEPPAADAKLPLELKADSEGWRAEIEAFSSSPVVAGNRVYLTDEDGNLHALDVDSGKHLWRHKLAPDQVHASPLFAQGKLYVPMNNGSFHIVVPKDEGPEVLDHDMLEGNCLGAPALANGQLFVHTTERLYCFGQPASNAASAQPAGTPLTASAATNGAGAATRLQVVPADFVVEGATSLRFRLLDASGKLVKEIASFPDGEPRPTFEAPPFVEVTPGPTGEFTLAAKKPGAGEVKVTLGGLETKARVRKSPALPYSEDFESIALDQPKPDAPAEQLFGLAPVYWFGGRVKWDVREKDGSKVLGRILDNPLFQRTITFFGDAQDSNYTFRADVMVDGNRRGMSSVGLINQRYLVQLKGNYQQIEVSSNFESLKVAAPCAFEAGTWYTLESRVDLQPDGSAIVRGKCWKRGDPEPEAWTIEVPHAHAHRNGSAGLYGFTPQSRFKAYVDNIQVTPNE